MGYVNLAWVILLYNGLSPKSKDILFELQIKFHSHGIGTAIFEVREFDPMKTGFHFQEVIDDNQRLFENKTRNENRQYSSILGITHVAKVKVHNPILIAGEEVFSWTISHSGGLNFSNNILTICEGRKSELCLNFTYKDYSPKKSLKGVQFYSVLYAVQKDKRMIKLVGEKLKLSLKYENWNVILDQRNSIYPFFPTAPFPTGIPTSILHCKSPFVIILRKPRRLNKVAALIKPFHWKVWILMLVTFIISIPMLYGIAWLEGKIKNRNHPSMQDIFWLMISTALRQDSNMQRFPGYKSKIAFFLCHWELFILTASYCGLVLSALASPGYEWVPRTYEELEDAIGKGTFSIGAPKDGTLNRTRKKRVLLFERYLSGVKITIEQLLMEENLADTFQDAVERALTENYAFAGTLTYYEELGPRREELRVIPFGEPDLRSCTSLITNINSPNVVEVKETIQRLIEVGFAEKNYREDNFPSNSNSGEDEPLLIEDIKPALYILLLGTVTASIVFLTELIIPNL